MKTFSCPLTVSDAVETKHPLFSLDGNTTVCLALGALQQKSFAAIGVHCLAASAPEADPSMVDLTCRPPMAYLGILSITDILSFMNRKEEQAWSTPIRKLLDISPEASGCGRVSVRDCLSDCFALFSTGSVYHAIASCSNDNKFWMLAQSDIVACLLDRETQLPYLTDVFDTPIWEVSSATTTFITPGSSVDEAIDKVLTHHGVPLIDTISGEIMETLSVSDFSGRASMAFALTSRERSVADFLRNCKGDNGVPPITLCRDNTVRDASRTMIINGVHRIWIQPVEKGSLPQVISLTDVLLLLSEMTGPKLYR